MTNILNFKVFFYVIFAYLLGSSLFGKPFYQTQYAGLYLSDFIFLFAALLFLIFEIKNKKIFFPIELKLLVIFLSITLFSSLFVSDFTVLLTLRQAYHLISLICFVIFVTSLDNLKFNNFEQRIIPIFLLLFIFSSILFEPGYADSIVVLMLIVAAISDKRGYGLFYYYVLLELFLLQNMPSLYLPLHYSLQSFYF